MLERGKIKKEDFEKEVRGYIHNNITKDKELGDRIFDGFASFVWKYDIIDELIEDDEISDIKIYDWDHIRVKREGHRENSSVKFRSEKAFSKFVEHTAIKNKVSISDQNAAQNFVDKTSSDKAILRFNVTTGFINSSGKYMLSIRKILKHKRTTEELIEQGLFNQEQADYLIRRISEGGGVLVAGKGGSGKTTLLNWMIDFIPEDCSGLVIQENEEMFSNHPDMMFQHTVTNRGEGKIEYNLGDLARNGLLADIDYFIIGEIKGAEALYLLNAVYTGAKGWASVHGASAQEAMKKLTDYIKYNSDYTQEEALQMLIHLDTVIFMENYNVKEIAEVVGYSEEKGNLEYKMIAADGKMLHDNDNKAVNSKAETKENKN
jgi:pilus assembly protein CpaF